MASLAEFIQYYRDRMTPDICVNAYIGWVKDDDYLVLRQEVFPDGKRSVCSEYKFIGVKCAKRGNDVYAHRVQKRFDAPLIALIHNKEKFKVASGSSNVLFITLTYDSKRCSLDQAWKNIAKEYNLFMTYLRRAFGSAVTCRCFEAFKDSGFPHIHVCVWFDEMYFNYSYHEDVPHWVIGSNGKGRFITRYSLRIDKVLKDFIGSFWHSFVDIEAVERVSKAVHYIGKYVTKAISFDADNSRTLKTLAFCWAYRKQAYAFSNNFRKRINDLIKDMRSSNRTPDIVQLNLMGEKLTLHSKWVSIGVFSAVELSIDPKEWHLVLSDAQIDIVNRRDANVY